MCTTSCGYVTPDGMEFPQHLPSVSTLSSLAVCSQAASNAGPRPLALQLLASPSALKSRRNRLGVGPWRHGGERDEL